MGSWKEILCSLGVLVAIGCFASTGFTPLVVWPPIAAAAVVLIGAALAVDFFGVARMGTQWTGFATDYRRAWSRARSLEGRFFARQRKGSPRTHATARSLLLAYAECDRLRDAEAVVNFLGADTVFAAVGHDAVADGLRAVALAELGRMCEATKLCEGLDKSRRRRKLAVVAYANARVAELDGRPRDALARAEVALAIAGLPRAAHRDLAIVKARALAQLSRPQEATVVFAQLVHDGWRKEVEAVAERAHERGDAAIALAARQAVARQTPYR